MKINKNKISLLLELIDLMVRVIVVTPLMALRLLISTTGLILIKSLHLLARGIAFITGGILLYGMATPISWVALGSDYVLSKIADYITADYITRDLD